MGTEKQILIVDDNTILREGLRSLLASHQGFQVVDEAGDGQEAIQSVDKFLPDLVLMDLSMPRMNGIEATREIKKKWPGIKILAFTVQDSEEYIMAMLKAGADGYILKDSTHDELIQSIENILAGNRVLSSDIEEALRESEERFRAVFESAAIGIEQHNLNGHFLQGNTKLAEIIGLTAQEIRQRSFKEITHPDDLEREEPLIEQLIRGERSSYTIEKRYIHKDGHPVWVRATSSLAKEVRTPYRISIIEDITERKKAEDALKKSEEKYRELVENINDVIFELDENGRVTYISPTCESVMGACPTLLIGKTITDFLFPEDRAAAGEGIRKVMNGQVHSIEVRIPHQSGEVRWVRISSRPIAKEERIIGLRGILTDLTERKRMEEERIIIDKLESTGILAGGIAHDFNNLLAVILGNLELARIFPQSVEMMIPYLEAAEKAAVAAQGLTRQFITFAKGGAPVKKMISLTDLLKEHVTFALRGSPAGCTFSIPSDIWKTEVDENQIGQVIRNMVLNAREAMPEGGMVSVAVKNETVDNRSGLPLSDGDYVKLSIGDQGSGIPGEVLPKIFDPYFSTRKRGDQKGMGLGLTICHSIIQKHGGTITVASRLGEGTTFHIYLPASREGEFTVPEGLHGMGRVLVMDDEEMVRKLIESILQALGYEVTLAEDGEKAIECYRQAKVLGYPFDAVILDLIVSGGTGGKDAIREFLKFDPQVKAIVSSGYSNDPVIMNYELYGFSGALTKPYRICDLHETLSKVIGKEVKD